MKQTLLLSLLAALFFTTRVSAHEGHDHDHATEKSAPTQTAEKSGEKTAAKNASDHAGHDHDHDEGDDHDHEKSEQAGKPHSHAEEGLDHDHGAEEKLPAGSAPIVLDVQAVKNLRLTQEEIAPRDFTRTVFALGRIEVLPENRAVVSSRIDGRAVTVRAKPDQQVRAGDVLLAVESRQPGEPPPQVALAAPKSGVLAAVNVAEGQPVSPADSLVEIVDLTEVQATARVPEHFAGRLRPGQEARIRVAGFPEEIFAAELAYLGTQVESESATLAAVFRVKNPGWRLRPGMRAEFSIVTEKRADVLAVPLAAVQGTGGNRHVYVNMPGLENAFVKTPVVVGERNDTAVEILEGLKSGQRVVARGAYALESAGGGTVSLKAALDAAHGHSHAEDGSELQDGEGNSSAGADDHDHAAGAAGDPALTWFFAALSGVLALLLVLSLVFRKQDKAA